MTPVNFTSYKTPNMSPPSSQIPKNPEDPIFAGPQSWPVFDNLLSFPSLDTVEDRATSNVEDNAQNPFGDWHSSDIQGLGIDCSFPSGSPINTCFADIHDHNTGAGNTSPYSSSPQGLSDNSKTINTTLELIICQSEQLKSTQYQYDTAMQAQTATIKAFSSLMEEGLANTMFHISDMRGKLDTMAGNIHRLNEKFQALDGYLLEVIEREKESAEHLVARRSETEK